MPSDGSGPAPAGRPEERAHEAPHDDLPRQESSLRERTVTLTARPEKAPARSGEQVDSSLAGELASRHLSRGGTGNGTDDEDPHPPPRRGGHMLVTRGPRRRRQDLPGGRTRGRPDP